MTTMYMIGYSGRTVTRAELLAWPQFQKLDDETARRALALVDASIIAGRPLGFGGIFRTETQQLNLFLSRHHRVASGGCCMYNGYRYQLNDGQAHAAPPRRSYHEATTAKGESYAIDFIGDLKFLASYGPSYGIRQFGEVNGEPWHGQPSDIPNSRSQYTTLYEPLKVWALPKPPVVAPTRVFAPKPTLRVGAPNNVAEVRNLQMLCNFWGWRDSFNMQLLVDGVYQAKTAQAVMAMQRALGFTGGLVDGVYGPMTAGKLQAFLDAMVGLSA